MRATHLRLLAVALFSLPAAAVIRNLKASQTDSLCSVQAWVRAEDLSPDHISHGELRVKVSRVECADQIVSVVLRLQLNEFGEFVYLKEGVVLPEKWQAVNQSTSDSAAVHDVVYDYQPYAEATSDPELWNVGAEERRAWITEDTLLDHPNLTHPIVTPFTVAVPAVNYPPGTDSSRHRPARNARHSFSDLGYQYIAIVTFTDGRTVDVLVGHTAFVPVDHASPTKTPSSWNVTFKEPCEDFQNRDLEKCLPKDQRSEFIAEITLENGNIVQKGRLVKGRVTIHSTHGSTTMSEISVGIWTAYREHWAQAQAVAGGDSGFYKSHERCGYALSNQPLNAESSMYAHIFDDKFERTHSYPPVTLASSGDADNSTLTPAHPYFDFQFEVPRDTVVDFASYYSDSENQLLFNLDVLYAPEVADCMGLPPPRPPRTAADEAAAQEELLWEPYARLGHPANFTTPKTQIKNRRCLMELVAMVPITVVGSAAQTSRPVAHYLTPDLPAPVLQAGALVEVPKFPVADPVASNEPVTDTTARLLQPHPQSSRHKNAQYFKIPDPTQKYRRGHYAGLLWKKKIVAEERGFPQFRPEVVEPEGGDQKPLNH